MNNRIIETKFSGSQLTRVSYYSQHTPIVQALGNSNG